MVFFRLVLGFLVFVCPPLLAEDKAETCPQKVRRGGRRPARALSVEEQEEAAADTKAIQGALALYNRDLSTFHERFSREEERELFRKYLEEGDDTARTRLIHSQLPWVINIAKKNRNRGLELEDLIQEGNLGLVIAVAKFDLSKNTRFSTYATWWIRQSINNALREGGHIRVPAYIQEIATKWKRARAILADRLGRVPSNEEVATEMGLDLKVKKIRYMILSMNLYVSQGSVEDAEGNDGDIMALQAAPGEVDPMQIVSALEEIPLMLARLKDLVEPREREVLLLRFGVPLDDGIEREPMTLKEIGERYGLTRERVRQIESSALDKLGRALGNR